MVPRMLCVFRLLAGPVLTGSALAGPALAGSAAAALIVLSGCGQAPAPVSTAAPAAAPVTADPSAADPAIAGTPAAETGTGRQPVAAGHPSPGVLRLASTTSTRDSGLFDVLLPEFEARTGCRVDVIAVGTGAALKLGEQGDVDAVFVHARAAEMAFMEAGHGVRHEPVMHNFFLIAGPPGDPAGVAGLPAADALREIARTGHRFVSRGDGSGTHRKELAIWESVGGRPEWDGYLETGQGMGPTLVIADEKNGYVLTDEGTWLKRRSRFRLKALVRGGDDLRNPYAVIVVSPDRHAAVHSELADRLVDFLISETAQQLIADYRVHGEPLFYPDRLPAESVE